MVTSPPAASGRAAIRSVYLLLEVPLELPPTSVFLLAHPVQFPVRRTLFLKPKNVAGGTLYKPGTTAPSSLWRFR
ncbi:hypothetical protein KC352_g39118 [Hortaea werneckii]|nr:hypothetical protein KC352_g39118 [Hortaea werneckii]